jgi:hypothetical protein
VPGTGVLGNVVLPRLPESGVVPAPGGGAAGATAAGPGTGGASAFPAVTGGEPAASGTASGQTAW